MYYIYRHIRTDKNEPFYIGRGTKRDIGGWRSQYGRAYVKCGRNKWWQNIVEKTAYEVEIIFEHEDLEVILNKEVEFIALYKDTLCNKTIGGKDGALLKKEWHPNWGKKLSKETRLKKSISMKNSKHSLRGKKLPKWWCERISKAVSGVNNPMYGKTGEKHHNSKKVIDTETGEIFNSITEAAKVYGYRVNYMSAMLHGTRPNKTKLKFYGV